MTKVVHDYAQPDVEAHKGRKKVLLFVETPESLKENAEALKKSISWLKKHEPDTRGVIVLTVPRRIRRPAGAQGPGNKSV